VPKSPNADDSAPPRTRHQHRRLGRPQTRRSEEHGS
jgi:hypothetical protein